MKSPLAEITLFVGVLFALLNLWPVAVLLFVGGAALEYTAAG